MTGMWIPWVANDARLKNHYYYLVTHVDFDTPMKAKYHDDGDYFEVFGVYPNLAVYQWYGDITAWMNLPDIYLGGE